MSYFCGKFGDCSFSRFGSVAFVMFFALCNPVTLAFQPQKHIICISVVYHSHSLYQVDDLRSFVFELSFKQTDRVTDRRG